MDKVWKCNHVKEKIKELTGDNLEERAKAYLRDELKLEESSVGYFYEIGTEEYIYMNQNCTFGPVEHLLNKKFEVLHLHRDTRHDWGDDGGYLVSISKKDNLFYLHIVQINYNGNLEGMVLDEDDWEKCKNQEEAFKDYFRFSTLEETQEKLIALCDDLDYIIETDEDDGQCLWDDDCFDQFDRTWTAYEKDCLRAMSFAYGEYKQDKVILHNLTKTKYKPNFTDEDDRIMRPDNMHLMVLGIIPMDIKLAKNRKLTVERFNAYHSVIEQDFMLTENDPAKTIVMFMGFAIAKHPKMSKDLLNASNNKGFEWKFVQEVYNDQELFYKDLCTFMNYTEATKKRFNEKLIAVEEWAG